MVAHKALKSWMVEESDFPSFGTDARMIGMMKKKRSAFFLYYFAITLFTGKNMYFSVLSD